MAEETNPGFRTFLVVWGGLLVSLIGTNLTGFALAIWVYQQTGSTTQLSFVLLATSLVAAVPANVTGSGSAFVKPETSSISTRQRFILPARSLA